MPPDEPRRFAICVGDENDGFAGRGNPVKLARNAAGLFGATWQYDS
jgi:hypothetical protein